jgi:hypothetical protein
LPTDLLIDVVADVLLEGLPRGRAVLIRDREHRLAPPDASMEELSSQRLIRAKLAIEALDDIVLRLSVTKTVSEASALKKTSTRILRMSIFFAETFPHLISS